MDIERRKELLHAWKNRRPEKGVIAFRCKQTGDVFLGISTDTGSGFNSSRFQLSAGLHPNKKLQALWTAYGEQAFDCTVERILKYENPEDDHTDQLKALLQACFQEMPQAGRIWP